MGNSLQSLILELDSELEKQPYLIFQERNLFLKKYKVVPKKQIFGFQEIAKFISKKYGEREAINYLSDRKRVIKGGSILGALILLGLGIWFLG